LPLECLLCAGRYVEERRLFWFDWPSFSPPFVEQTVDRVTYDIKLRPPEDLVVFIIKVFTDV
jgi:hypothetical protein